MRNCPGTPQKEVNSTIREGTLRREETDREGGGGERKNDLEKRKKLADHWGRPFLTEFFLERDSCEKGSNIELGGQQEQEKWGKQGVPFYQSGLEKGAARQAGQEVFNWRSRGGKAKEQRKEAPWKKRRDDHI